MQDEKTMAKSTVYVETSVIGYLTSRDSQDLIVKAHQESTRDWWASAAGRHDLCAAQVVLDECAAGDPHAASERLAALASVKLLPTEREAEALANALLGAGVIPVTQPRDALHIAIAATNGVEFLVTWNYRHIANPTQLRAIEQICRQTGFEPPLICSPEQLLGK